MVCVIVLTVPTCTCSDPASVDRVTLIPVKPSGKVPEVILYRHNSNYRVLFSWVNYMLPGEAVLLYVLIMHSLQRPRYGAIKQKKVLPIVCLQVKFVVK